MLTDCGAEKTGESGPVEAAIRYCFFIEIVSMFFRIRLPVTVAVPILTLMNEVQACPSDYSIVLISLTISGNE
jgi:hypothetical protein